LESNRCQAAAARISSIGGTAKTYIGSADVTVHQVTYALNPYGLHFAFLDPYNLLDLPFSVIAALAKIQRMDMLIHVSVQDLQRNLDRYTKRGDERLEIFMPGWRDAVNINQAQNSIRAQLFEYWLEKIRALGMLPAKGVALISGEKNQRLYWLVFISRSDFANSLWGEIGPSGQRPLL
jgi:three-Cys-motif partner protein